MSQINEVVKIYERAFIMAREDKKSIATAKQIAIKAVEKAGYYLDGGKWKKKGKKVTPKQKIEINDRSNENLKLSQMAVTKKLRMA